MADFALSNVDVAVIVNDDVVSLLATVSIPAGVISVPADSLPETLQFTVSGAPPIVVTVAENCCCSPCTTIASNGAIVTLSTD